MKKKGDGKRIELKNDIQKENMTKKFPNDIKTIIRQKI